jgi:hypothetical protein
MTMETTGQLTRCMEVEDQPILNIDDTRAGIDGKVAIGCEHGRGRGIVEAEWAIDS